MSFVSVSAPSIIYIEGILVNQTDSSITINTQKPRSSKRLNLTYPMSQVLYVLSTKEEDKKGNNTYMAVRSDSQVAEEFEGEVTFKNNLIIVKTEEGTVTIPASVSVEISEEVEADVKAKSKKSAPSKDKNKKDKKAEKSKGKVKSKPAKSEDEDEDDDWDE